MLRILKGLIWPVLIHTTLSLAAAQSAERAIYAATNHDGLFKSTDGGANWTPMGSGVSVNTTALAIDPSDPSILYVGTSGGGRLYRSNNGGQSWTQASSGLTDSIITSLTIDPVHPNTLYAGTATGAFFPGNGVFKTTDGGQNWIVSNSGLPVSIVTVVRIDPHSTNTIYAGTNFAGVYKSTDGGVNWNAANSGMNPSNVQDLAIDPVNSATIYTGVGGCSFNCLNPAGVLKTSNGGTSWAPVNSGLTDLQVWSLAVDPSDTNILYAGTRLHGLFKTVDGGVSWSLINPALLAISGATIAIDPQNHGTLYVGTVNGVFKSIDSGASWFSANNGIPTSAGITALAIEALTTPTIVSVSAHVETLTLSSGQKNSLLSKLRAAQESLAHGNLVAARNQLLAFIDAVQALENSGRLESAAFSLFVSEVQGIINSI